MNRRDFMQATALGTILPEATQTARAVPSSSAEWYVRPMRWAQIAFVEDDPGNYNPTFWLEYLRRCHVDAVCLSAGGCVAFYPTKLPFHYRSKWLGDRDTFGELLKGCRDLEMNVVARTDPHAAHQDVYAAHPDWIMATADGKKRRHWADASLWVTCALGPYNFDFMTKVTEEIVTLYGVDGVFSNRWAGSGMCYCEHCRENFKRFSNLDLPTTRDPLDPSRREYILWREQRLFELWRLWDAHIKAINPHASYIANAGGGALSDLDMVTIGNLTPTLFADRQGRHGSMPIWMNGKSGKEYRATLGRKPIAGIFSVGVEEEYRWKDSVQSSDEIRLWVADGIAQGLRPWVTKFNAKPIDKRWLPVVQEIYQWHHANESYLRNVNPLAQVALVYSQQTATFYGGDSSHAKVEDPALGVYQALVEGRVPFEMVHDRLLDGQNLRPFRTLILPNIAALSQKQCNQIVQFVHEGGSIVATYETSLYDEWGKQRADFGLSQLFGASFADQREGPMHNSYLELQRDPQNRHFHPLLKGLEDASRILNGAYRVLVAPIDDGRTASAPLTVVPSYPDLPMEEVYPRPVPIKEPGVFLRSFGKGRVVYFPWDVDRIYWEVLSPDHSKLLQNAVRWAHAEPQPLEVEGPGILDIAIWSQEQSVTVHLVNLTNPMMMKGAVREIIPIGGQDLRVRIPERKRVSKARLLVANRPVAFQQERDLVHVQVASIAVHEVVALDLTS